MYASLDPLRSDTPLDQSVRCQDARTNAVRCQTSSCHVASSCQRWKRKTRPQIHSAAIISDDIPGTCQHG